MHIQKFKKFQRCGIDHQNINQGIIKGSFDILTSKVRTLFDFLEVCACVLCKRFIVLRIREQVQNNITTNYLWVQIHLVESPGLIGT